MCEGERDIYERNKSFYSRIFLFLLIKQIFASIYIVVFYRNVVQAKESRLER